MNEARDSLSWGRGSTQGLRGLQRLSMGQMADRVSCPKVGQDGIITPQRIKCLSLEIPRLEAGWALRRDVIEKGSANVFCKGPDSNYFWLCRPVGLCHNYSTLPL